MSSNIRSFRRKFHSHKVDGICHQVFRCHIWGNCHEENQETPFLRTIGSQHNIHTLNNMPISDDICPAQLIRHVLHTGETVNKAHDHIGFANKFENEYFQTTDKKYSVVCLPLKSLLGLFGALYLEGSDGDFGHEDLFNERKCDLLQLFAHKQLWLWVKSVCFCKWN